MKGCLRAIDEKEVFSLLEMKLFLQALDDLSEGKMYQKISFKIMVLAGVRLSELCGLKWEDVDFEKRTMYIRRSVVKLVGQEPEIKLPKTISSIRQMAIPQALCDVLLELKKEQDRKKALLGEKWHETGFLFTDWCGQVMHPHTPTKQFDKFLKKYGFRHLKFHGLRHSSATYLLSNGCDMYSSPTSSNSSSPR